MGILGKTFGNPKIERPKEPYYRQINRNIGGQEKNSDSLTVPAVKLVIPNGFVRSILVDCIEGYLADCVQNNRFPFSNNSMKRKLYLSWYDT